MMSIKLEISENGKEHYTGVEHDTLFADLQFHDVAHRFEEDYQVALHTNLGSLTVFNRLTGYGWRDIETGYRSPDGTFWLASGNCDVRRSGAVTISLAIDWVKARANTCRGV